MCPNMATICIRFVLGVWVGAHTWPFEYESVALSLVWFMLEILLLVLDVPIHKDSHYLYT